MQKASKANIFNLEIQDAKYIKSMRGKTKKLLFKTLPFVFDLDFFADQIVELMGSERTMKNKIREVEFLEELKYIGKSEI